MSRHDHRPYRTARQRFADERALRQIAGWRECAGCGRDLEPDADDTHCPSCAVDRLLYDGMDRDE